MNYNFTKDPDINDVLLIRITDFKDNRGFLCESYNKEIFHNIIPDIIQVKYAYSHYGVLRGLHFQITPYEQGKLIKCIKGSIFDIAVDIRLNSPTYGKWVGHILSEENNTMMYVPPGFAHGVVSISKDGSSFYYLTTNQFSKNHEAGLLWSDPNLAIHLPIPHEDIILSDKDKELPKLDQI